MVRYLLPVLALLPSGVLAQAVQPGRWDVTSRVTDLALPGVPGFVVRMILGKSRAEHKQLAAGEGIAVLLAPDPKAECRVDAQRIADGRYRQTLSCPQPNGAPMTIVRDGSYDAAGFAGHATVSGTTPRGPMRIVLDQRAARVGG